MRRGTPLLALAVLACAGCSGYSSRSLIDPKYKTIYVQTFNNLTYYRGFELRLTREIINKINARTHLQIAPRDRADTVLSGQVSNFRQQVLTEDIHDNVRDFVFAVAGVGRTFPG